MEKIEKMFVCTYCGKEYKPYTSNQKSCKSEECFKKYWNEKTRKSAIKTGRLSGEKRGVMQLREKSVLFKTGIGDFQRRSKTEKELRRFCERCNKDLIDATHHFWCLHHKDGDRTHNPSDGSNWELLCKRCHNIEHRHWEKKC